MIRKAMITALIVVAAAGSARYLIDRVGPVGPGATRVPTGQIVRPSGDTVVFNGRPVDIAVSPDGATAFVKDNRGLVLVDTRGRTVRQELRFPSGGGSMHGLAVSSDGRRVYLTTAQNAMHEAAIGDDGVARWTRSVPLPGPSGSGASHACGIALYPDRNRALVCLSLNNTLGIVDLDAGKLVAEIPVGVAPYAVRLLPDGRTALVSNWGGRRARKGDRTAPSGGTEVVVDARGVASTGTVGFVDLVERRMVAEVAVGLHPCDIALSGDARRAYIANSNSDTISVISVDRRRVVDTIRASVPGIRQVGAAPNALAVGGTPEKLYVALGLENLVLRIDPSVRGGRIEGQWATGWYPAALSMRGEALFVANVKGTGSRWAEGTPRGLNSHEHSGSVTRLRMADPAASVASGAPAGTRGERRLPGGIRHVVYIIKENRTYDQVLGDLPEGDGEPGLCLFGREVTPNHHALAEEFVLLDNYYCNGILSADGHSWSTEGNVTDHLEKSFGGFTRSYTFGDDPLTYSSTGFIWDAALSRGLTFRNYGEMDYAETVPPSRFREILADWRSGSPRIRYTQKIGIDRLRRHSAPGYPGWNMEIPDVVRADIFVKELSDVDRKGQLANLTIVYLPNDHTEGLKPGAPTPRAYMADNDLALGRVVEALTRSRFWRNMAIFVIEDDPQAGTDHVDGHRSFCFVVSPYTRDRGVVSAFYNQSSVLHTIGRLLGFPPAHRGIAMSPPMDDCFSARPDYREYSCRPIAVPLTEANPPASAQRGIARVLARRSINTDFRGPDRIDEDTHNRAIWASARTEPYPAHLAGAHGSGLAARGLARSDVASAKSKGLPSHGGMR